ncbi:hypothetical protein GLOTRDRAFT_70934 [Gloeophyllum trabeum ATCC 11539]|uniref:Uncharacterized protein n=1 Tax=Gloeophyllum trabeum (strain ATCC 11539 / FP-39264 / Madison 617) TaxID=670483 RepID=S7QI82_GLOTA|nr:uncharacterized protein GLOTRDRAFT_70934 [Gloeophyllum trabeum ATCC 11539]EPQ59471.1 hypothetical protein GLOTRDRAFT_70934 [Gloeophyllum trabeum ATCC 11539]
MAQPTQEGIVKEEAEDALLATPTPETLAAQESITTTSSRTIRRVVINIDEDEEKKPKPVLQLKYKGFSISDRCLCVVVEPWPPIRSASRAPSVAPLQSTGLRRPSIAPPDFVPSTGLRERTPLFLPDDERQETPAPFNQRILLPVPGFNDPPQTIDLDENDESDMMAFTQVLNSAGGLRGTEADDDDMDGAVLFGDADETREL